MPVRTLVLEKPEQTLQRIISSADIIRLFHCTSLLLVLDYDDKYFE